MRMASGVKIAAPSAMERDSAFWEFDIDVNDDDNNDNNYDSNSLYYTIRGY